MAAALKFFAERTDVLALGVEHEDRRMLLERLAPLVNHIHQPIAIHRDIVRRLPGVLVGKLRPLVLDLELVFALADDQRFVHLARRMSGGSSHEGGGPGSGSR